MPKKISFFIDLIFDEAFSLNCLKRVTNTLANHNLILPQKTNDVFKLHSVFSIYDIPNYLKLNFIEAENNIKILKAPLYNGFLINLQNYKNLDAYLSKKLGRGRKSQLKRYKKRLDFCINPTYKIFFGDISKSEYSFLFDTLKLLTVKRFNQKKEINFELPYLDKYYEVMFKLILNKQASIFVIYHDTKPICITLNFIQKHTVFHWNSCFDIDYSMFNLGHVNMLNHLEWSFNNNIKVFDMGRGDFHHKRKYVDTKYLYEDFFLLTSNNSISKLKFYYNFGIIYIRYYLISFLKIVNAQKIYSVYSKYKYRVLAKPNNLKEQEVVSYHFIDKLPELKNLKQIRYFDIESNMLVAINKFIFDKRQKVSDLIIYTHSKKLDTYFLASDKLYAKIIRES